MLAVKVVLVLEPKIYCQHLTNFVINSYIQSIVHMNCRDKMRLNYFKTLKKKKKEE